MPSIDVLLHCLSLCTDTTIQPHLGVLVPALLSMTGRITMLGISRWTDKGAVIAPSNVFLAIR